MRVRLVLPQSLYNHPSEAVPVFMSVLGSAFFVDAAVECLAQEVHQVELNEQVGQEVFEVAFECFFYALQQRRLV